MGNKRGYNVEVIIKNHCAVPASESFQGRLVGFITAEERRALINTEKGPAKVFTSESISPDDPSIEKYSRFFVVATSNYPGNNLSKIVFISPKIQTIMHTMDKSFTCADGKVYVLKKLN